MPLAHAAPRVRSLLAVHVRFTVRFEELGTFETPTLDDVIEAFALLNRVYALAGEPDEPVLSQSTFPLVNREKQLRLQRLSMESPLEFLASIPPGFVAGAGAGGLLAFAAYFERVFNLPLSIKVDRQRLQAEGAAHEAERTEQELRRLDIEKMFTELRGRADNLYLAPAAAELVEMDKAGPISPEESPETFGMLDELLPPSLDRTTQQDPCLGLVKALRSGEATIESVLARPPDYVMAAKVFDMLLAVPRLDLVQATRILVKCRVALSATFGQLSERQRRRLAQALREST